MVNLKSYFLANFLLLGFQRKNDRHKNLPSESGSESKRRRAAPAPWTPVNDTNNLLKILENEYPPTIVHHQLPENIEYLGRVLERFSVFILFAVLLCLGMASICGSPTLCCFCPVIAAFCLFFMANRPTYSGRR